MMARGQISYHIIPRYKRLNLPCSQEQAETSAPAKKGRSQAVTSRRSKKAARPRPSTEDDEEDDQSVVTLGHTKKGKGTGAAAVAALVWPEHQRPLGQFRDNDWLDSQPVATILAMKDVFEKMNREVNTDSGMHRDTKPAPIVVKRSTDDCFTALSRARFDLRMPLSDWTVWWPLMPVERVERYKTLNLKVVGAESQISKSAINR